MHNQLFTRPFYDYRQSVLKHIRDEISRAGQATIDDVDGLTVRILQENKLTGLNVDWDSLVVYPEHREEKTYERDILGDTIEHVKPVYKFEVKYSGSRELLYICPSQSRTINHDFDVQDEKIIFEIKGDNQSRLDQIKAGIQANIDNQARELSDLEAGVKETITASIAQRQQELRKHADGLTSFGVPVKDSEG